MNATEIGNTLHELGFTDGSIVETIMVTENVDGSYNAAPMGVLCSSGFFEARPYKSSTTYRNLHHGSQASINVTDDPLLFLGSAFKTELDWSPCVADWVLKETYATIILEKQYEYPLTDLQMGIKLAPTRLIINRSLPRVFSRGRSEAIEAVIHATRVKVFHSEGHDEKIQALLGRLDICFEVISRVSGVGSSEMQVVETLKKLLTKWGIPQ